MAKNDRRLYSWDGTYSLKQLSHGRTASVVLSAPASTENFLNAMASFNFDLLWGALSPELQSKMKQSGTSEEMLRQGMEEAKKDSTRVASVNYIGGYQPSDGNSLYFYVVGKQTDGQVDYVFYVFTLNVDGKILRIE